MSLSKDSSVSNEQVTEVAQLAQQKFFDFQAGMAAYLQADIPDWEASAKVVAEIGGSRLLDYGGYGEVVLIIPPLINRASILEDFARGLGGGAHIYMLDWGDAGEAEAQFGAEEYAGRVAEFAAHISQPFHLLGYCMGGLVALRAAPLVDLRSVILLATPWNFEYLRDKAEYFSSLVEKIPSDFVPAEILQNLFFSIDPWRVFNKFSAVPSMGAEAQERFFAIEKWANDGVPMPKKLFEECVGSWVAKNDKGFSLAKISVPVLAACPKNDKIVPLSASLAVAAELESCTTRQYATGHIGLVTKDVLHDDIFAWIKANSNV